MDGSESNGNHHLSYLVLNGEIEEEVSAAIHAFNRDWASRGQPQYAIHTIVRGHILRWAMDVKDQFVPSEFEDFKSLLEFFLDGGKGVLDKGKFTHLLHSLFKTVPDSAAARKRLISSCALLCSLALSSYQEKANHVAIIEGWTIYMAEIMHFATQQALPRKAYSNELDVADAIINNALEELLKEVVGTRDLLVGHLMEDVFVFKHRTTIILGLLAYYGLRLKADREDQQITAIIEVIDKHLESIHLWGEAAIPYITNLYWFLKKIGKPDKALFLLKTALATVIFANNNDQVAFTSYYLSAEDSILLLNDQNTRLEDIRQASTAAHVAEILVHLLAINDEKQHLQNFWIPICDLVYEDFIFAKSEDIFLWRSEQGTEQIRHQQSSMQWTDLVEQANTVKKELIPELLKEWYSIAPLFFMVYPHRLARNLVVWSEQYLFNFNQ
jgi:hypothetical protein